MAKNTKRVTVIAAAAVAAVAVAGSAFAFWSSSSTGKATVAAGTLAKVVVTDVQIVGTLRPGATADLSLNVMNPDDNGQVKITSIALTDAGIRANAAAEAKGCTGADTGVVFHPETLASPVLIEAGSTEPLILEKAVEMTNASVNGCQGANFTVPVVITAETTGEAPAA